MKYSNKEQQLINALHFGDFLNQEPVVTYRALALHCFSKNLQNCLADSVRRCYNAMTEGTPYRLTKEFDDLIEFPIGQTDYIDDKMVIVNGVSYTKTQPVPEDYNTIIIGGVKYQRVVEEPKPQTLFQHLNSFDMVCPEFVCNIVRGWLIDHTIIETEDAEKVTFTIHKEQLQTPK